MSSAAMVAFTPKGGCPLKLDDGVVVGKLAGSIHPQGWVPTETVPTFVVGNEYRH